MGNQQANRSLFSLTTATGDSGRAMTLYREVIETMTKTNLLVICVVLCIFFQFANAQMDELVVVHSWKKGTNQVVEGQFNLKLTSRERVFSTLVASLNGSTYQLIAKAIPSSKHSFSETGRSTDSWQIELREVQSSDSNTLGKNLLSLEAEGTCGDNFPREDLVGFLYPKTKSKITAEGRPMIDGKFYYPIYSTRKIKVEGFFVFIKVEDFKLNEGDPHKTDFINVSIKFVNGST